MILSSVLFIVIHVYASCFVQTEKSVSPFQRVSHMHIARERKPGKGSCVTRNKTKSLSSFKPHSYLATYNLFYSILELRIFILQMHYTNARYCDET